MENDLFQWQSDPYFPAAEDIQSSVDRLESIFRAWKRGQAVPSESILDDSSAVPKPSDYNYQIELATACDTVKWQVEEFENEILSVKSDKYNSPSAQKRRLKFTQAIRSQIRNIEDALTDVRSKSQPSHGVSNSNLSNFLSGGKSSMKCPDIPSEKKPPLGSRGLPPTRKMSYEQLSSSELKNSSEHSSSSICDNSNGAAVDSSNPIQCESGSSRVETHGLNNGLILPASFSHEALYQPSYEHPESTSEHVVKVEHCEIHPNEPSSNEKDLTVCTKMNLNKSVIQPINEQPLWKLFLSKAREYNALKRRQSNSQPSNQKPFLNDSDKDEDLFSSCILSVKELKEDDKRLIKLDYFQWLRNSSLRLYCLRPLQTLTCVFLICGITGFGHLYITRNAVGSIE